MLRQLVAATVFAVMLTGTVMAGPLEDGLAVYVRGDYAEALRLWKPLADQGDAAAQFNIGVMYATSRGVAQDHGEAMTWYRMAADQGHASAQFNLGLMYATGQGVAQDYGEAAKWYRQTAHQGHADAQHNPRRHALPRPGRAAGLRAGAHVVQYGRQPRPRGSCQSRDAVLTRMTPNQIAKAQRLAREWKPLADR